MSIAAPPTKAAMPIAPVLMGWAPALLVDEAPPLPKEVVADGAPDVNGAFDALEAPEKAGAPEDALSGTVAVALPGFRTLNAVSFQGSTEHLTG